MKKCLLFFWGGICALNGFLVPHVTEAASLYLDPPFSDLYMGDSVQVAVRLDTDEAAGECVNTVDAVINYSPGIDPVDVTTGGSIFSVWVESPVIDRENRTITFAGGIPNGYCGRVTGDPRLTNELAQIIFRLPGFSIGTTTNAQSAEITFADVTTAYLNDGLGTKASLQTYPATINLIKETNSERQNAWQDEIRADSNPPQEFSIELVKDDIVFGARYYVVFNTTDKETGIDQYQIMEEPLSQYGSFQWGRADAPWVEAKSPYVLKDQSLNSIIRVRALDKAGNEYIASLMPDESLRSSGFNLVTVLIIAISIIFICLIFLIAYTLFKRMRNKRLQDSDDSGEAADNEITEDGEALTEEEEEN